MIEIDAIKYVKGNNFNPSKKMGQNFLINEDKIQTIINSINFNDIDGIIEVGPGLGALTKYLVETKKQVVCIELDKRLYNTLKTKFKDVNNINFINNDILKEDIDAIAKTLGRTIIVSNLPYSISSLVVIKFLKSQNIKTMYCMLQKEMANRLIAKPRQKEYNSFSVLTNHQAQTDFLVSVGKNNFYPAPEVDSCFIKIDKKANYEEKFDKFLKTIFLSKRKTLNNNLKGKIKSEIIKEIFNKFNLSETVRSEELTPEQIYKIFKYLEENNYVS